MPPARRRTGSREHVDGIRAHPLGVEVLEQPEQRLPAELRRQDELKRAADQRGEVKGEARAAVSAAA